MTMPDEDPDVDARPNPRPIPPHVPGLQPPHVRACRCDRPIRNAHLKPVGRYARCARCLLALIGDQYTRARPAGSDEVKGKDGSSAHRVARVQKFEAEQRRKAEKRKRQKRNRR